MKADILKGRTPLCSWYSKESINENMNNSVGELKEELKKPVADGLIVNICRPGSSDPIISINMNTQVGSYFIWSAQPGGEIVCKTTKISNISIGLQVTDTILV